MAKSTINITEAIAALPKPTSLQFAYPKDWASESTGIFGALANGNWGGGSLTGAAQVLAAGAGDKATAAFFDKTGSAINQRNKALFKDLPFRQVAFAWSILPMSADHAKTIDEFLKMVKVKSAPTLSSSGAIFDYPALFDLEIRSGAGILFKSDSLALTNLEINYTAAGFWSQHTDGYPTKLDFSMEFKELRLAIQENLETGTDLV
jgi:hypothetical protein